MAFIQNVSFSEILKGDHISAGENAILIQIADPEGIFPMPNHIFKDIYQFNFFDVDTEKEDGSFTIEQSNEIVAILTSALRDNRNIIVHCTAGLCRSGAVCEIGTMMGFTDTGKRRIPNSLVKRRMIKSLSWSYDD